MEVKVTAQAVCTLWIHGERETALAPRGTGGSDTCPVAGSRLQSCPRLLESPAVLLRPHQLTGRRAGTRPLRSRCVDRLLWGSGSADTRRALLLAVLQLCALQASAPSPRPFPLPASPLGTPGLPLLPPPLPACSLG